MSQHSLDKLDASRADPSCDIPEPPPFSDVVDALGARARARWSAVGQGFRRWGSASWGRAWALGVGLIGAACSGAVLTWMALEWIGSIAQGPADLTRLVESLPQWVGSLLRASLGLGLAGLALFAARCALWAGVEGPIRLWSRFALGVAGSPSEPSRQCFAPWTRASLCCLALCFPFFFVMGPFAALNMIAKPDASDAAPAAPAAPSPQRERALSEARRQALAMSEGPARPFDDRAVDPAFRAAFWTESVDAWALQMSQVMDERSRLSSPAQALQKNEAALALDQQRVAELDRARARLVNGFWESLGSDKEAPKLAFLRSAGSRWADAKEAQGKPLAFCLPAPSASHNEWASRRGAFSPQAKAAMALYFNGRVYESSPRDPSFYDCSLDSDLEKKSPALVTLGSFLSWDARWVKKNDDPTDSEREMRGFHTMPEPFQRWAK